MAKIVLTGLNGYGGNFVKELFADAHNELLAVVSGSPQKSAHYEELAKRGIPAYKTLEECLEQEQPDMAIICTPAHIHFKEVMTCLHKGVHVYCEKPLTTTLEDTLTIGKLAKEKGLTVAVGFQWSYSKGIQSLKKDILDGKYGQIIKFKNLARFVRPISYFTSSSWKGRNFASDGSVVYDNVINNVNAHYLHNMLFLAGKEMTKALDVTEGTEYELHCYRAHNIETFDTFVMKIKKEQQQIELYGTLVAEKNIPVEFTLEGEKGRIIYPYDAEEHIAGIMTDGTVNLYDRPDNGRFIHYQEVAAAIEQGEVQLCDAETVVPFQSVTEYVRQHADIKAFDPEDVVVTEDNVYVKGLSEKLEQAYRES